MSRKFVYSPLTNSVDRQAEKKRQGKHNPFVLLFSPSTQLAAPAINVAKWNCRRVITADREKKHTLTVTFNTVRSPCNGLVREVSP